MTTLGFTWFSYEEDRNAVVRMEMQDPSLVCPYEKLPDPDMTRFR